jgi:Rod binding domain-containing protein
MQVGTDSRIAATVASAQADRLSQAVQGLAREARTSEAEQAERVAGGGPPARDVPREFSKLLATMLVKEMRQALPEGFFGEGTGSDIFDGWLDEHIGTALAQRDGLRLEGLIAESMRIKVDAAKAKEEAP